MLTTNASTRLNYNFQCYHLLSLEINKHALLIIITESKEVQFATPILMTQVLGVVTPLWRSGNGFSEMRVEGKEEPIG